MVGCAADVPGLRRIRGCRTVTAEGEQWQSHGPRRGCRPAPRDGARRVRGTWDRPSRLRGNDRATSRHRGDAMALGYDGKLYILAIGHRGSFQKKMFGIDGDPDEEQPG